MRKQFGQSPVIQHQHTKTSRNEILHIGWVGHYGRLEGKTSSIGHKNSLFCLLFPILKELDFDFKLSIIGIKNAEDKEELEAYFDDCDHIHLNLPLDVEWLNEQGIYSMIKEFDIGLSPMINHDFAKSKSAFKVKQYLSCGVPVLASPVGENKKFVLDGNNGFLCKDALSFKENISRINNMSDAEFMRMQGKTRSTIHQFSMDRYCNDMLGGIAKYIFNSEEE